MAISAQLHAAADRCLEALHNRRAYFHRHELVGWRALGRQNDMTRPSRFYLRWVMAALPLGGLIMLVILPHSFAAEPPVMRELVSSYLALTATALLVCTATPLLITWLLLRAIIRPSISLAAAINKMGAHVGGATALGFLYGLAVGSYSVAISMNSHEAPQFDLVATAATASAIGAFIGILWTLVIQIVDVALQLPSPGAAPVAVVSSVWVVQNFIASRGLTPEAVLQTLFRGQESGLRNVLTAELGRSITSTEWAEISASWQRSIPAPWLAIGVTAIALLATIRRAWQLERPRWVQEA